MRFVNLERGVATVDELSMGATLIVIGGVLFLMWLACQMGQVDGYARGEGEGFSAGYDVGYRHGWYDGLHTCQDKPSRVTMRIEECDTNESGAETGAKAGAHG